MHMRYYSMFFGDKLEKIKIFLKKNFQKVILKNNF